MHVNEVINDEVKRLIIAISKTELETQENGEVSEKLANNIVNLAEHINTADGLKVISNNFREATQVKLIEAIGPRIKTMITDEKSATKTLEVLAPDAQNAVLDAFGKDIKNIIQTVFEVRDLHTVLAPHLTQKFIVLLAEKNEGYLYDLVLKPSTDNEKFEATKFIVFMEMAPEDVQTKFIETFNPGDNLVENPFIFHNILSSLTDISAYVFIKTISSENFILPEFAAYWHKSLLTAENYNRQYRANLPVRSSNVIKPWVLSCLNEYTGATSSSVIRFSNTFSQPAEVKACIQNLYKEIQSKTAEDDIKLSILTTINALAEQPNKPVLGDKLFAIFQHLADDLGLHIKYDYSDFKIYISEALAGKLKNDCPPAAKTVKSGMGVN